MCWRLRACSFWVVCNANTPHQKVDDRSGGQHRHVNAPSSYNPWGCVTNMNNTLRCMLAWNHLRRIRTPCGRCRQCCQFACRPEVQNAQCVWSRTIDSNATTNTTTNISRGCTPLHCTDTLPDSVLGFSPPLFELGTRSRDRVHVGDVKVQGFPDKIKPRRSRNGVGQFVSEERASRTDHIMHHALTSP